MTTAVSHKYTAALIDRIDELEKERRRWSNRALHLKASRDLWRHRALRKSA